MEKYLIALMVVGLVVAAVYHVVFKTVDTEHSVTQAVLKKVSVEEFAGFVADDAYTVIDVRTPAEIAKGKVTADALEIDFYASDFTSTLQSLDRDTPYAIYCRSGNRSGQTLAMMKSLGFQNVVELAGGKSAWETSGRDLVVDNGGAEPIQPVACTMDAKICPDGSAVGRVGPNCEFAPCPD